MKRVVVIVMDGVGIGELPDAYKYGDEGSNTLGNIATEIKDFSLPNLEKLGLGNIDGVKAYKKLINRWLPLEGWRRNLLERIPLQGTGR